MRHAFFFCEAGCSRSGDKILQQRPHVVHQGLTLLRTRISTAKGYGVVATLRFGRSWRFLNSWPRSKDLWSIDVDELAEWAPSSMSRAAWTAELARLWTVALLSLQGSGVVVAALSFEASKRLETFERMQSLKVDTFTSPSLYLLNQPLEVPVAAEQYYRVLTQLELTGLPASGKAIARSARSSQAMANDWEFDNTLYIASKFGE